MKEDKIGMYVAPQGGKFVCISFRLENVKERNNLKDLSMDGNIILNSIFIQDRRVWIGFI
jgi:hypothetical protein